MVPLGCFLEEEGLHELASGFEEASSPSLKWVLMRSQAPNFPEQGRQAGGGTEEEQDITGTQQSPWGWGGPESLPRQTLLTWSPAGPQS